MASPIEKIQDDTDNLARKLAAVGQVQQSIFDKTAKTFDNLSKSADEFGKKIAGAIDPATYFQKTINKTAEEYEKLRTNGLKFEQIQLEATENAAFYTKQLEEQQKVVASKGKTATAADEAKLEVLGKEVVKLKAIAADAGRNVEETQKQLKSKQQELGLHSAILAIYSTMMSLAGDYDKLLSDTAKAQGTTKDEINEQYGAIQKVNTGLSSNLASNQEILAGVTATRKEYALNVSQLAAIGKEAANISRLTGLSADEAVKFQTSLAEISGTSLATQEAMTVVAAKAAEAFDVPMGQVMRDVANASASVRTIFKGNSAELIIQAAEARKLGTSLDGMAKSAESLLNFETSIGAELKASALLGQSLNFNESRRLAFSGDLIGAEKALQLEIEKVGDLDKLNYNQRKALAEATGKDFGELQKIQTQKKNLLEAEREFPEIAEKMRKSQEQLNQLKKSGPDQRREELRLLLEQKTAETELGKLTQAKQAALLNIGKLLQPLYEIIMSITTGFYKFIAVITSFENPLGKWAASGVVAVGLLVGSFFLLKLGIAKVLDFLGNALAKSVESVGVGIGKGVGAIGNGLLRLAVGLRAISFGGIAKLALLFVVLTGAAIGLAYAMSLLGTTSATQMIGFAVAMGLMLGMLVLMAPAIAALMASGVGEALLIFLGALAIEAVLVGAALRLAAPAIESVSKAFVTLVTVIGGVITKAFDTMLGVFTALPGVMDSVASGLMVIANIGFFKLTRAAAGVATVSAAIFDLGKSLSSFPVTQLTSITTQLMAISEAASGIGEAVTSLKQLSGIQLPTIDIGGLAAVSLPGSDGKKEENSEIKAGLEALGAKFDALTNMMASGGIVVNLDGTKVNNALARSASTRGAYGQATIA